jgi:SAM-dependent methyltransferase
MKARQDRQREHYEAIHDEYSRHYYDATSNAYRDRFINRALLRELDPSTLRMAEIMCGEGPVTDYVIARHPGAAIEGFDISGSACTAYSEKSGRPAQCIDITREPLPPSTYDAVFVSGGLHHIIHDFDACLDNVHRALKSGGTFAMFEPNADYFLNFIRKFWYRRDQYFDAENEQALDYHQLHAKASQRFDEISVTHAGGPAFFLVLNSLIFRLPVSWKRFYAPPLTNLEAIWNLLPGRMAHAYFIAQWRKR